MTWVYEATADEIMPIADVDAWVQHYCDAGVKVQYRRVLGSSHPGSARDEKPAEIRVVSPLLPLL